MCGFGGDLLAMVWDGELHAYRGVGRAPAGATADFVRDAVRRDRRCRCSVRIRSRCPARSRLVHAASRSSRRGRSASSRSARCTTRRTASRSRSAARGSSRTARSSTTTSGSPTSTTRTATSQPGDWIRQPELARTIRTLADDGPDAYYRGPIGAAIAERLQRAGGCMTAADVAAHAGAWVEPLRAPFRDVEILEMPPPTQGIDRARGAAHRRRSRPRRRRPGSRAPADRGGEARARRPRAVSRRSRRDDDRAGTTPRATTGSRPRARRHRSGSAPASRRRTASPTAARSTCARPTATACWSASSSRTSAARARGCASGSGGLNLHNRGSAFVLDDAHPNGIGPRQDAVAHADSGDVDARRRARGWCSAPRAGTVRRRRTPS